jgi:hypothetical protein
MTGLQVYPPVPESGGAPVIPPPPPRVARRRKSGGELRLLLWLVAFGAGVGAGAAAYRYAPQVDFYFDYWVALALG